MCKIIENLKFYVETCVTEILRKKTLNFGFPPARYLYSGVPMIGNKTFQGVPSYPQWGSVIWVDWV